MERPVPSMNLPDFLVRDSDGFIRLAGHRIGLHHVVRLYDEGYSPESIGEHYPTLPLSFYLDNQQAVQTYSLAHAEEVDQQMARATGQGPDLLELRRRMLARKLRGWHSMWVERS